MTRSAILYLPLSGRALVAQRIEHLTTDQKVGGSNPSERANRSPGDAALAWAFVLPTLNASRDFCASLLAGVGPRGRVPSHEPMLMPASASTYEASPSPGEVRPRVRDLTSEPLDVEAGQPPVSQRSG